MSDRCGYAITDADGNQEPCDRPATGWRWYQDVGEHEDLLDVACDWHANEGGARIYAETALADLAAKVEAVCDRADGSASDDADVRDEIGEAWIKVRDLRALLADALPQDADSEPASVPLAAEDDSGAAVDVPGAAGLSEAQGGVTACNYGAHDFVLAAPDPAPIGALAGMHLHICANCEATYYEHGGGPCWRCRSADTEMRDGGAGL